jgi:hypothetical protein
MSTTDFHTDNVSFAAADDLSAYQFRFLKLTGADEVDIVSAATDRVVGVLQNKPAAAGRGAAVAVVGVIKMQAGGAITAGDPFKTNATGFAVSASSGDFGILGLAYTTVASGGFFRGYFSPTKG